MTIRASQKGLTREPSFEQYLQEKPAEIDLEWGSGLNVSSLFNDFQEQSLKSFVEGVTNVITTAQGVVELLREVASFVVNLVGKPIAGLLEGLILAVRQVTVAFTNLFAGVSMNVLTHFPETHKSRRKPSEVLYDVGMAYLDDKDANRPITVDDVFSFILVITYSYPNPEAVKFKLEEIKSKFKAIGVGVEQVVAGAGKFSKVDETWQSPLTEKGSSGMKPDFGFKLALTDIAPIKSMVDELSRIIAYADTARGLAQKIQTVLNLVDRKLTEIQTTANNLLTSLNSVIAFLSYEDAAGILSVKGTGEAVDFARAIINSPHHPTYRKSEIFETINDQYKAKGQPPPLNKQFAEEALCGGALLLHFQVPNIAENIAVLDRLINAMFTSENPAFRAETYEAAGERITAITTDRIGIRKSGD